MRIRDFQQDYTIRSAEKLECALQTRHETGVNSFWLRHGNSGESPVLLILAKNSLASLHYFPDGHHPGFSSIGAAEGVPPDGTTVFYLDGLEAPQDVNNDTILPFELAVEASKEFFASGELPACIEWREL